MSFVKHLNNVMQEFIIIPSVIFLTFQNTGNLKIIGK
jgi:hypothetical protein